MQYLVRGLFSKGPDDRDRRQHPVYFFVAFGRRKVPPFAARRKELPDMTGKL
jgi:hypothetical protein